MPKDLEHFGKGSRALIVFAAACVAVAALKLAAPIVVPLLLAAFIAAGMKPIIDWLRRLGVPSWLAVTASVLGVAGAMFLFSTLVVSATGEVRDAWPTYGRKIAELKVQVVQRLYGLGLKEMAISVGSLDLKSIGQEFLAQRVAGITRFLSVTLLVILVTIFMLVEVGSLDIKLERAREQRQAESRGGTPKLPLVEIQRYLIVKTGISALTGMLVGLLTWGFGLSAPVLWGLLAFLLNFVPQIGSVIAGAPAVALALIELGVGPAALIAVGYLVINMVLGNVVEPRITGQALGLSPVVVLVSVFAWGWVLGPVGALLSVPLTVAVRIYFASTDDLRWVATLLGPARDRQLERLQRRLRDPDAPRSQRSPPSGGGG